MRIELFNSTNAFGSRSGRELNSHSSAWHFFRQILTALVTVAVFLVRAAAGQPQLMIDSDQGLLLAPDGSLWAWGGTDSRMVSLFGAATTTPHPIQVGAARDWREVAASGLHVYGIKTNGTLWGWGWLGDSLRSRLTAELTTSPQQIGTADRWAHVSVGVAHVVALTDDGSLWTWGRNDYGQLGDGTQTDRVVPIPIALGTRWKSISSGSFNSFALRDDGTVWAWGSDLSAEGEKHILRPRRIDASTHWTAIAAGSYHLLALKADHTLWILGQNVEVMVPEARPGQFLQVTSDEDWTEILSGENCYAARKRNGSWWGYWPSFPALGTSKTNRPWMPSVVPFKLEPWAIAVGKTSAVLGRDGALATWGPRLGYVYPSQVTNPVQRAVLEVKKHLPDSIQILLGPELPFDETPRQIWKLPTN